MKNSKLRRVLLLLACAVMLVSLSVGATLAYLQSTDSVKNTFTVGQVNITLDEADVWESVTEDGYPTGTQLGTEKVSTDAVTYPRVKENKYKVYPGMNYDKDPTVHVTAGSEDCYVGVHIKLNNFANLHSILPADIGDKQYIGFEDIVLGGVLEGAVTKQEQKGDYLVYTMNNGTENYQLIQLAGTGDLYVIFTDRQVTLDAKVDEDLVLFTDIDIPDDWEYEQVSKLNNLEMEIKAYAVQAEGFANAYKALAGGFPEVFDAVDAACAPAN